MNYRSLKKIAIAITLSLTLTVVKAQTVNEPKTTEEWTRAYQPFRIAGSLYYVGTYDLILNYQIL